jgi:GMP synthase-like glutamine amidotransferase
MLHIIQNDPQVPPGNLAENLMVPYQLHHPYRDGQLPGLEEMSELIVLGGAMGANDDARYPFLTDLKKLISQVVAAGIPYLGICLGGQLLAAALGAQVVSSRWEELGTLPVQLTAEGLTDRLFQGLPDRFTTFQWHHDSFDLPHGAVLLASSPACLHQAFRFGNSAWGLQFHPEVTEQIIRDWSAWDPSTACRVDELVAAFKARTDEYRATARQMLNNFYAENARQLKQPVMCHPGGTPDFRAAACGEGCDGTLCVGDTR